MVEVVSAVVVTVGAGSAEGASEEVDCCRMVAREEPGAEDEGSQPLVLVGLGVRFRWAEAADAFRSASAAA